MKDFPDDMFEKIAKRASELMEKDVDFAAMLNAPSKPAYFIDSIGDLPTIIPEGSQIFVTDELLIEMIKDVVNDHTVLVVHIEPESVYLFKRIYL
jgi:hypothetical protein